MKRAVISLSGGLDSASLLAYLIASQEYEGFHCYGFDYGQRHNIELQRAQKLVEKLQSLGINVSYQLINVRDVFSDSQSALNPQSDLEVPKESYNSENLKDTVVENRNVIFSSIIYGRALAISKKYDCRVDITLGMHSSDNSVYPDCRPESVEMSKELYKISNYGSEKIEYLSPFIHLTKKEVLGRGLESLPYIGISYNDFYSNTSSCYDPKESKACGLCATCRDRLEAFEYYELKDPVEYTEEFNKIKN